METVIILPETMPRITKAYIPSNWKRNCTISVNKFYDKVHNESLIRTGAISKTN